MGKAAVWRFASQASDDRRQLAALDIFKALEAIATVTPFA